jgi:hypothetical protein
MPKILQAAAILAMGCLPSVLAHADIVLTAKVSSNGGGLSESALYKYSSTTGQPAIGTVAGASYVHSIGFWFYATRPSVAEVTPESLLPRAFRLGGVQPNPVDGTGTIEYAVPAAGPVSIRLYDITGRVVKELIRGLVEPGTHRATLPPFGLPSGVYFCRMEAGRFLETQRLVLLR